MGKEIGAMGKRRIIDAHSHMSPSLEALPLFEKACGELGIEKICFMGCEWPGVSESLSNGNVRKAIRRLPGLVVGFGGINLWEPVEPEKVDRLRDEGFRGIKLIVPPRAYHDESFGPYYQRASELRMPICFHLGIVARREDFACRVDNHLMRPIYLDCIARSFPELTLWGAHLGNPWYEEATMSCRWNPNLFFDLSGSTLKKKTPEFLGGLLWWTDETEYKSPDRSLAWQKIQFGSDVAAERIVDVVNDYENLVATLGLSEELAHAVFYETAARALRAAGVEC